MEGEVWRQDYKMQTVVYPRSQNIETRMVACSVTSDYISQVRSSEKIDL